MAAIPQVCASARTRGNLRLLGTAMAGAGVPMRTLQEWMGHRDIETTQRYADYAPRTRDAELVAAAFSRTDECHKTAGTPRSRRTR
jgi:integrase